MEARQEVMGAMPMEMRSLVTVVLAQTLTYQFAQLYVETEC